MFSSSAKHQRGKMEAFTFLNLLLLATGASCFVCKHFGQQCRNVDHPYHLQLVQQLLDDPREVLGIFDPFRICSGTLIHEQWVLTAGDCYYEAEIRKPLKVKFSSHPEGSSNKEQVIPHSSIKKFSSDSDAVGIMLVKLPEPVSGNITARLPPPSCTRPEIREMLLSLNYPYRTYESGKERLYCVGRNITACDNGRKTSSEDLFFCAVAVTSVSPFLPCPSDTGGAILRRDGTSDVVYGVKISGYKFMDVCAEPVRQWIDDTINDL